MMYDFSTLPKRLKTAVVFATDALLLPVALWMSFALRLGPLDPSGRLALVNPLDWVGFYDIAAVILGSVGILRLFRLHQIQLRAVDLDAVRRMALCAASVGLYTALYSFFLRSGFPRSIPVLLAATYLVLLISVRVSAFHVLTALARDGTRRAPVAIYGAGAAGVQLALSLKRSRELDPVMFVDDNPALHDVLVSGIRVKPPTHLQPAAHQGRIEKILIAIPSMQRRRREELIKNLAHLGCEVLVVPSYVDLISGSASVDNLRTVDPIDLLGREMVDLDTPEVEQSYAGRTVMVTGGGGSIGSELCHQILRCKPEHLVVYERSEPALFEIDLQLRPVADSLGVTLTSILGSITDRTAVDKVMSDHGVEVVLHAAAYKHVPIIESNEIEGARNNVLGTQVMVEASLDAGIDKFILVSTDKAVRPTNVMGATKRMAELIIYGAQQRSNGTKFSLVRFGNVLGSSGSVVPIFSRQIAEGGPLTVTHAQVTRYFMTIPEAARLVLLAGAYAEGDDLFILDMGKPIKIIDLARRMIELSGRTVRDADSPDGDISIDIIGLRPGEKLNEELIGDDQDLHPTRHPKIYRAGAEGIKPDRLAAMLADVSEATSRHDTMAIRSIAKTYVEGFGSTQGRPATILPFSKSGLRNRIAATEKGQ